MFPVFFTDLSIMITICKTVYHFGEEIRNMKDIYKEERENIFRMMIVHHYAVLGRFIREGHWF